ncbi:Satratoxin biosynthesis SC3 cluster transcription factor SAT20 [Colletotrichum trifolii]|uniref:Satratoxin biosynthesis SC3 cluster transcription factor SAT20 n=1 Tax=Colletotrichum trifolii TaxID=5466 RepID=A0A4R8RGG2_COLTR|nr:Satratoxin biosynthesis SC3 cluster transcription factor SAT20 [Colletotrichum trifolii]
MSSQIPGPYLTQVSQEKSQQPEQHGQLCVAGVPTGQSSGGLQGSSLATGLTEGLSMFLGTCHNCFGSCAISVPEGYQLIRSSDPVGYGSTRGYEAEKPPSADVESHDVYLPTTMPSGGTSTFPAQDVSLLDSFVNNFQPVQEAPNSGLPVASALSDGLVYSSDLSVQGFYPNVTNAPASDSQSLPNVTAHIMGGGDVMPPSYNESMMVMAPPSAMQHQSPLPVTTSGFPMGGSYVVAEMSVKSEDLGPNSATNNFDIVYHHQRPPASKRGPFKDPRARQETAITRRIGSCVRCKMQRIRCVTDAEDPTACCVTCKPKPNSNHHKQVSRQPCIRAKITELKCMKPGPVNGYEWTLRWGNHGPVDNIANWASGEVRTIQVADGYAPGISIQLHVRQFIPQKGDKLERSWVTRDGVKKSVPIPPYAITDLEEAQSAYQEYIKKGVLEYFNTIIEGVIGARNSLLYETYSKAWEVSQDPRTPPEERELLLQTLQMWLAVRLTTKSVEIVGNETLGMNHGILDSSSPQHGCIPLPPVMGAQLDFVLIQHIQTRLRREMLEKLQKMTQQNKQKTWLTTYLVTFILLHNIALLAHHDASYARKHGMKTKFARESDVHDYHYGGTILLAYFHYCNKGIFPFTEECRDQDLRQLAQLDEQALHFVQWTRNEAMTHKREWDELHGANEYEQAYFFVSQLFQRDWQPQKWAY